MPELPEVETNRRETELFLLGRSFKTIDAGDSRNILTGTSPGQFSQALVTRRIEGIHRRGKYFWWSLDDGRCVLLHLGMTGWMKFPPPAEPLPKFARVIFEMSDGTRAVFTDPRRFGKIRLLDGPAENQLPVNRLGIDALEEIPSAKLLKEIFSRRRVSIKALLLDQTVFAGVGNWIADEVLYQAKIRPTRLCGTLTAAETRALRVCLQYILHTAVRHKADDTKFPKNWLFHFRWGKKTDAVTAKGEKIRHETVAGRTTAWVPSRQQ